MKRVGDVILVQLSDIDSNIYVMDNFVIDAGTGFNFTRLMTVLGFAKKQLSDFEWVINTHGHFDHVGGNGYFINAKVAIHEAEAGIIEKGDDGLSMAGFFDGKLKPRPVGRKLKDGDVINGLKVIHTPGHSPGSICLYDEKRKLLFSGDTVFADGVGRTDLEGGDQQELVKSLEKILGLDVKTVLPGHGPVVKENAKQTISKIKETLAEHV